MPPKPVGSAFTGTINGIKPTETDMKIMCAIMENLTAPIQINAEGAAKSAGMKNKKVFGVMYSRFRAKYNLPALGGTRAASATVSTGSGDATSDGDDDGSVTAVETPVKKMPAVAANGSTGGLLLTTPTATTLVTPGMAGLSMADSPETPSKPPAGRKRVAAAANLDPEDTPAKRVRKPRWSSQNQREEAAGTAGLVARPAGFVPPAVVAAGVAVDNAAVSGFAVGGDTSMGDMEGFGGEDLHDSEAVELLALADEVKAFEADVETSAVADGTASVNYI